jgi:hypothetical protein
LVTVGFVTGPQGNTCVLDPVPDGSGIHMCFPVALRQTRSTKYDRTAEMDELVGMLPEDFPCNVVVKEVTEGRSKGGLGLFSTSNIKQDATVCAYSGYYAHWSHVGKRSHAISVGFKPGHVICGLAVREVVHHISPAHCGSMINSTQENSVLIDDDANVDPVRNRFVFYKSLGKDKFNRDVGVAAIAMIAKRDIAQHEQILWSYAVTEMVDLTPFDLKKILQEALELKNRPKKRVIPEPVERV